MTESDIAKAAIEWLTPRGFECYSEVPCYGGRADIVAVRQSVIWIVETKVSLSAELCCQCRTRLGEPCNGVLAVAGGKFNHRDDSHPLVEWLGGHGIGFAKVSPGSRSCDGAFDLVTVPKLRRLDNSKLRERLCEQQKSNVAGTSGPYWTKFKDLVSALQYGLREGLLSEMPLPRCMDDYRQRSVSANRRALTDYLERKLIPGWSIERRDNRLWIAKDIKHEQEQTK